MLKHRAIKQFILVLLITPLLLVTYSLFNKVHAQIVQKTFNRTFTVTGDHLAVTEEKQTKITQYGYAIQEGATEVFTIFFPVEGDPSENEKIQKTLDSIRVTDVNGNILNYSHEETDSRNLIIKIQFPRAITFGDPQTIILKYDSYGLLIKSGAIYDVYVPGFPADYNLEENNVSETISSYVIIPSDFPKINFTLPALNITNEADGTRKISIDFETLRDKTVWIQIGTKQNYTFEFDQTIPNSVEIPLILNTFKYILPRDITSGPITQKVFYKEITPSPYSIEQDSDGNLVATFKTTANAETNIHVEGYAILEQNTNFDPTNSGLISGIPSEYISKYTSAAQYWESDTPEIVAAAKEIKGSEENVYSLVMSTYKFVTDKIDYSFVKKYGINERQGALETLKNGAGVCMEYSDLFIALMRAQGIPARAAFGYGFSSLDYESRSENKINHQWAEVYLPELDTWINVDTTWGEFGSTIIGGDLNHFYSHIASVDPVTPSLLQASYFGKIDEIPERDMDIEVVETVEISDSDLSQEELLNEYSPPTGFDKFKKNVSLYIKNINQAIDNVLHDKLSIPEDFLLATKIGITLSIILLFTSIIVIKRKRRKKDVRYGI